MTTAEGDMQNNGGVRVFSRAPSLQTVKWGSVPISIFAGLFSLTVLLYKSVEWSIKLQWLFIFLGSAIAANLLFLFGWRKPKEVLVGRNGLIIKRTIGRDLEIPWSSVLGLEIVRADLSSSGLQIKTLEASILIPEEITDFEVLSLLIRDRIKQQVPSAKIRGFTDAWPRLLTDQEKKVGRWWTRQNEIRKHPRSCRGPIAVVLGIPSYVFGIYWLNTKTVDPATATSVMLLGIALITYGTTLWLIDWISPDHRE